MSEPESPTRAAWLTSDGQLGLACQCGERIYVTLDTGTAASSAGLALTQFAVTCDCGASHWVTPVPLDGDAATGEVA